MSENDEGHLLSIEESCEKILRFSSGNTSSESLYEDELVFDAVLMNFIVIGESVSKLSKNIRAETIWIDWEKIKAFRNIIAHNYFGIDADEVWQIINNNIPILKKEVESILIKNDPE